MGQPQWHAVHYLSHPNLGFDFHDGGFGCTAPDGGTCSAARCREDAAGGRVELHGTVQCFKGVRFCFNGPRDLPLAALPEACRPTRALQLVGAPLPHGLSLALAADGTLSVEGGNDYASWYINLDGLHYETNVVQQAGAPSWGVAILALLGLAL